MPRREVARELRLGRPTHPALRPVSQLPDRARLFLAVVILGLCGLVVWIAFRLLETDAVAIAVLLIVLSVIGTAAVGIGIVTLTRLVFSAGMLPYLLGRWLRRLLLRR